MIFYGFRQPPLHFWRKTPTSPPTPTHPTHKTSRYDPLKPCPNPLAYKGSRCFTRYAYTLAFLALGERYQIRDITKNPCKNNDPRKQNISAHVKNVRYLPRKRVVRYVLHPISAARWGSEHAVLSLTSEARCARLARTPRAHNARARIAYRRSRNALGAHNGRALRVFRSLLTPHAEKLFRVT